MKSLGVTLLGCLLLAVLVFLGSLGGTIAIGIAVGAAVGFTAMVALGPERLGIAVLLLATMLAPLNGLRLSPSGNVGYADFAYVAGIALVFPRLLGNKSTLPKMYVFGCYFLVLDVLITALLQPAPLVALLGFIKIAWAMMVLPVMFNRLRPGFGLLNAFAWAFVTGQIISTGWALAHGYSPLGGGRAVGMTTHPNFFGLAGQMAIALLIFLWYRTPKDKLWLVWGAASIVGVSIIMSGSRASLVCTAVTFLAWGLLARTGISKYLLISGIALTAAFLNYIFAVAPANSAFGRLAGKSASYNSNLDRQMLFDKGYALFKAHPIQGNGFSDVLQFHNVYLEVAVGGGVLAVFAFLLILAGMVQPLFNKPTHWLSLMALSYTVFCFIGPTLYDRILWGALALVLVSIVPRDTPDEEQPESPQPRELMRKAR